MKISGKVFVVTGGANGIGRELVMQLLHRGARVAAVDVNSDALEQLRAGAGARGGELHVIVGSITDKAFVASLPQLVMTRFGVVDGLINCAGIIQPFVRLKDLDDAAIERVMGVNFTGTLQMTRAFLPHLLARPIAHIANVSSMGGFLPVPGQTIYGASKAAVKLLTEGLHAEMQGTNVRVTIIFPGAIATNIAQNSGVSIGAATQDPKTSKIPMTPAPEAATQMLDGIERDAYRVLVGNDAKMLDALVRLDPRRAAAFIGARMKSLLP